MTDIVSYSIALEAKKKGFHQECLAYYQYSKNGLKFKRNKYKFINSIQCQAPTYKQLFEWLNCDTEKFRLIIKSASMKEKLKEALSHPLWASHKIGNEYIMDGVSGWKIAYYPIFENGKTNEEYVEPRALVEKEIKDGTDFREVPLRYLSIANKMHNKLQASLNE